MDFINAIVLLLNYLFVPALSYGSQLALGAIFVSLIYGILRFAYFTAGDLMSFGTMFTILFTWYFQNLGINRIKDLAESDPTSLKRNLEKLGDQQGDIAYEIVSQSKAQLTGIPKRLDPSTSDRVPEAEAFGPAAADDLLWGRHASQAALEAGRPIHRIWCTSDLRSAPRFLQLLREAKSSGVLVEEVTWARLGQLTGGAVHQGIVLQTAAVETLDLQSLIEGCAGLGESPLLLALDGLTDPHNLGAIIRSAEALGAHGVVLPQRRSAGLTGSVAKVAAGALEHLPVARVVNLNRSLEALKQAGYRVIGLAEEGDITLPDVDLDGPLVIVTGSEKQGISLLTRRHCDQLVRVPLRGVTPSLNASVATAMCLYEVARRGWMKGVHGQTPSPRIVRPQCPLPVISCDSISVESEPIAKTNHSPIHQPDEIERLGEALPSSLANQQLCSKDDEPPMDRQIGDLQAEKTSIEDEDLLTSQDCNFDVREDQSPDEESVQR